MVRVLLIEADSTYTQPDSQCAGPGALSFMVVRLRNECGDRPLDGPGQTRQVRCDLGNSPL